MGCWGEVQLPLKGAASIVFSKSPGSSPALTPTEFDQRSQAQAQAKAQAQLQAQAQVQAQQAQAEKPAKAEKSKVKLFSRPGKIGISKDKEAKSGALPSPNASSSGSMYSMANSSSATIRPVDISQPEKEKDKEKHKHHFLSRQKHKLSSKEDHHLPLSSAASNSKPVDPSAPSSLYNFNLPPSPGPTSTSFAKSMSGLDLRHGGRALREKKKEEKSETLREGESSYQNSSEWLGPSSIGSGEDLRLCVEDLNRLVTTHIQRCVQKRCPGAIIETYEIYSKQALDLLIKLYVEPLMSASYLIWWRCGSLLLHPPDSQGRPGTAISLDPSHGSYSSQNTTLLGGGSSTGDGSGSRSRATSNVSYASEQSAGGSGGLGISGMPPPPRPFYTQQYASSGRLWIKCTREKTSECRRFLEETHGDCGQDVTVYECTQ
ncbi:hypothetical protein DID88_001830 [Monilinia fructigena]|uniref:Uncharacterized protein n=1 Tax=Monilinia fructigena TaxID=38457 RepID=A0A395IWW5_9HELO|nr:hypothetical protein DID88_001830 [Monilinia fructigena]